DFNFFKKRLNGSVEYFVKKTTDMLFYKDFPLSAGYGADVQLPVNVGSMMNHGIEVDLEGVLVRTKDVEWSLNLNFTHYKNKILKLDPAYAEEGIKYSNSILREGGSIYETYMYKYAGVDKSSGVAMYYKDDNHYFDLDGKEITKAKADELGKGKYTMTTERVTTTSATDATKYECGSSLPKLFGGFGTSLRVKDFDLSASLSYQLGGQVYDGAYQALMWTQDEKGLNMHKDLLKAWSPTNPNSNIPMWYDNMWSSLAQSNCDFFLTSSNYLSLNNLTLGYTFPKALLSKVRIGSLRVYLAGQNLAVVSARRGLDPRTTMGIGSMTSGTGRYSTGYYTPVRSIVAGLSVKF
ncbi:MAG: SusC/RagA family TonB-linked outer membrane protein, partial [Bacteroidaceae bacterium]